MENLFSSVKIPALKDQLKEIGIITENQNMFQLFEPTLQPKYKERVFEGKNWKLIINGRLGLEHKNLLEIILCKKYIYDFIEIENEEYLKVLYSENKIKRYMSGKPEYSYEQYKELLKDMMRTSIEVKTKDFTLRIMESLINEKDTIKNFEPPQRIASLIPEKVTLSTIRFGTMTSIFIENEFKLSYNKNQFGLKREIYQEIKRRFNDKIKKLFCELVDEAFVITHKESQYVF